MVLGWIVVTSLYAWYYITSILADPIGGDAYAMNWQFQLMMFLLFRFPYMVALLFLAIIATLVLCEYKNLK